MSLNQDDTSVRMAMQLQSAPSIQPLNKDFLHTTRSTHQHNELLVQRCVALIRIAALYKKQVNTYIHTYKSIYF